MEFTDNNNNTKKSDEQFFENICNNVTVGISFIHNTVDDILQLNQELIKHRIPTSLQLHLTLTSSKLQRNFLALKLQVEELLRLTKLYSVSWEKKNQSLKVLHKQYSNKQTRLNIALKKIEHLSNVNENMKKQRIHMNWGKMYLSITRNETIDAGWKQRIQMYNKRLSEGKSVADMFRNLDTPDSSGDEVNSHETHINSYDKGQISCKDILSSSLDGFSIDNFALDKFSNSSRNNAEIHFQSSSEVTNILDWVSQNEGTGNMNFYLKENINESVQAFDDKGEALKVDKDVQVSPTQTDQSSTTNHIQYSSCLHVKISRPKCLRKFRDLSCTIAINSTVGKIKVGRNPHDNDKTGVPVDKFSTDEFYYKFVFPDDAILESDEFRSAKLRIAFQLQGENNNMIAFSSRLLSDMSVPVTSLDNLADENELTLLSTINNEDFKFNQPCGIFYVQCYISQEFVKPYTDRSTQTLTITEFINALEIERMERCKSACVETEEKPVYTESDLDSLRNDLDLRMEQLQAEYEDKISTLVLSHDSYFYSKDHHMKSIATSPIQHFSVGNFNNHSAGATPPPTLVTKPFVKLKYSEQWGKGLPEDFLARLDMYNDASQRYHEGLKSKTKENVDTQITKRLHAENKLSKRQHNKESAFSKDVCLPAIFMPIKSSHNARRSARSYYKPWDIQQAAPCMLRLSSLKLPKNVQNTKDNF